jgi:mannose-6-phosphate isomerase-like protein (cupin superfamily)
LIENLYAAHINNTLEAWAFNVVRICSSGKAGNASEAHYSASLNPLKLKVLMLTGRAGHGSWTPGLPLRAGNGSLFCAKAYLFCRVYALHYGSAAGQGNAAHTHEIEEVFFVLKGQLTVFFETPEGQRVEKVLDQWDCVSCPRGVIHGYQNNSSETVFMQVMLGKRGKTELLGYADQQLFETRDAHLKSA